MKLGDTFLSFEEFEIKVCENNFTHLTKTDSATSKIEGAYLEHCLNDPRTHEISKELYIFNVQTQRRLLKL